MLSTAHDVSFLLLIMVVWIEVLLLLLFAVVDDDVAHWILVCLVSI
jgi:hypothetical protein